MMKRMAIAGAALMTLWTAATAVTAQTPARPPAPTASSAPPVQPGMTGGGRTIPADVEATAAALGRRGYDAWRAQSDMSQSAPTPPAEAQTTERRRRGQWGGATGGPVAQPAAPNPAGSANGTPSAGLGGTQTNTNPYYRANDNEGVMVAQP